MKKLLFQKRRLKNLVTYICTKEFPADNSYFIKLPNFQSSHRQNIINNYKQVEDRRMIVEAVAGAAVMEETEMDGMAHLNLTRDGKNLTEMEVSSSVKRV